MKNQSEEHQKTKKTKYLTINNLKKIAHSNSKQSQLITKNKHIEENLKDSVWLCQHPNHDKYNAKTEKNKYSTLQKITKKKQLINDNK